MIDKIEKIFSSDLFAQLATQAIATNEWTTADDIIYAVNALRAEFLDKLKLQDFASEHSIDTSPNDLCVGIVAAGNLPLVGFGDMFYALLCGCRVVLKPSSKDPLMRAFAQLEQVTVVDTLEELKGVDCLLAMGSDSTCHLLKGLMPKTPMLLRGSMHSIAILDGEESDQDVEALADDCFRYCSRGCRSVTHLYLPKGYQIEKLKFAPRQMPAAWDECYRYQRARAILSNEQFVDGSFYLLKERPASATAVIGYSFYTDPSQIPTLGIQHTAHRGNFGHAQRPSVDDFANRQNVVEFLRKLKS